MKAKKYWLCSYAHDVPCYEDFVVEASSEDEAQQKCEAALKAGHFDECSPSPCWDNAPENERVFVSGPAEGSAIGEPRLTKKGLVE